MLHFDTRAEALRTPPVRRNWPVRSVLTNGKLNAALKDLLCVSVKQSATEPRNQRNYVWALPPVVRHGFALPLSRTSETGYAIWSGHRLPDEIK